MDHGEARRVLGVGDDVSPPELRRAFRHRLFTVHPDLDTDDRAAARTRKIIDAYRLLVRDPEPASAPTVGDRTRNKAAFNPGLFAASVEALDRIGEITYLDFRLGLAEGVVVDGTRSLQIMLSRRADGGAELAIEPLDGGHPVDGDRWAIVLGVSLGVS